MRRRSLRLAWRPFRTSSHAEHWISFNMLWWNHRNDSEWPANDQHVIDTSLTMRFQLIQKWVRTEPKAREQMDWSFWVSQLWSPNATTPVRQILWSFTPTRRHRCWSWAIFSPVSPLPSLLEMEPCQDASGDIVDRCHGYPPCYLGFHPRSVEMIHKRSFTLWLFNIAMGNDPFIDGLPIKNGDFPWLC